MSTAIRPRQLNLDELQRLKWLLGGMMALVSLWTIFFLDVEALSLVGAAGAAIAATLVWPRLPGRVPRLGWTLAVPAIIVAAAVDFYFSPDTLPVLIRLAVLLVLYRAVAYRRKREDLQLIVLGMFLIVVAGVLTVSLGFAFLLLLFTACALGFLFVINLLDAAGPGPARTPEAESAWTRLTWRHLFGRLRAVADWRLFGFATALFVAVVLMSGVLFVLIPRFELASGFFLDKYITRKSRTGFTESVKFGEVTELIRDESIAMRVELTDTTGLSESPYWRLVVLDEYTPTGFKVSAGLRAALIHSQRNTQSDRDLAMGRLKNTVGGTWTFFVEPGVSRFLPLPGRYGMLRLTAFQPLQTVPGYHVAALKTESMTTTAFRLEDVVLTPVVVDRDFSLRLADARSGAIKPKRTVADPLVCLRGPAGAENEAVLRRVVNAITGGRTLSAEEFARKATAWLRDHHTYALAVKLPGGSGTDDIVRWVDSNEPGFCEYFAAGFTVLARAAGFPARVIAGFHGGVLNGYVNYYMVRNSDAHAWAEIFDGKDGWLRVDPTPGAVAGSQDTGSAGEQQRLDRSWSARFDSLRVLWYRRVVNFDSRTQVEMFDEVKTFTTDSGAAFRLRFDAITKALKAWLQRPWSAARIGRSAGLLAGLAGAIWALVWLGRRGWERWQSWRRPEKFDPVRRTAGKWLARLRLAARTPEASRKPKGAARPAGEEPDPVVVADLQRLRYGRRETWPEPAGVFRRARKAGKAGRR